MQSPHSILAVNSTSLLDEALKSTDQALNVYQTFAATTTVDSTVSTLTAATASGNSADLVNTLGRGVKLVVDITVISGTTPSLTVTLQGKDVASGKYYAILASAALTAVGTTVLTVYPGLTAVANSTANDFLPRSWRVAYTIAGTTPSVTATIGASLI